jgi:hypothetical protein
MSFESCKITEFYNVKFADYIVSDLKRTELKRFKMYFNAVLRVGCMNAGWLNIRNGE